jgi:hypothetical protein
MLVQRPKQTSIVALGAEVVVPVDRSLVLHLKLGFAMAALCPELDCMTGWKVHVAVQASVSA